MKIDTPELAGEAPVALKDPHATLEPGAPGGEAPFDQPSEDQSAEPEPAAEPEPGSGDALSDEELERAVFALVFASPEPLSASRLARLLDGARLARVNAALAAISERLSGAGLPLELREIAGSWRFLTVSEMDAVVAQLVKARKAERLSPAGLETLSVVAYRQPVTKAEIESIRGVQCGAMLRNLVDRGLARVTGRADVPGHPLQYGTTKEFLDRFGLGGLGDLPRDGELLKE